MQKKIRLSADFKNTVILNLQILLYQKQSQKGQAPALRIFAARFSLGSSTIYDRRIHISDIGEYSFRVLWQAVPVLTQVQVCVHAAYALLCSLFFSFFKTAFLFN